MKNIALIGGVGAGKTTLATTLMQEDQSLHYIYMSKYGSRIPLTLIATSCPDLLTLSRNEYIRIIMRNQDIPLQEFTRQQMEEFNIHVDEVYGDSITSDIVLRLIDIRQHYLADNVHKVSNVRRFKENRFYIVGLHCRFETQVLRRLKDRKPIDPEDISLLERQVQLSNRVFQISDIMQLADLSYDTDQVSITDYPNIAREILERIR